MCRLTLPCRSIMALAVLAAPLGAQSVAGGFGPELLQDVVALDSGVQSLTFAATADFDEDGLADLVMGATSSKSVRVYPGDKNGGLGAYTAVTFPTPFAITPNAFTADFDGDGHADLLAKFAAGPELHTAAGGGDGSFAAPVLTVGLPQSAYVLGLGDLDGDTRPDLILQIGVSDPRQLAWMHGQGDGTFATLADLGLVSDVTAAVVADFDGDALADLAHLNAGQVSVRRGLGGGAFAAPQGYSSFATMALEGADMDLDGELDLVHGSASNVATILPGLGDATFGAGDSVLLASQLADVDVSDLDRDGWQDLAAISRAAPALVTRRMGPQGPIGQPQLDELGTAVYWELATADFDGDGLPDLAANGIFGAQLLLARGGLGPFIDLGGATVTTQGAASLELFGMPKAGSQVSVQLLPPTAALGGLLVLGLAPVHAPFAGASLVPSADALLALPGLPEYLVSTWPAGVPPGMLVYVQAVFALAGGGKAVSNAAVIVPE